MFLVTHALTTPITTVLLCIAGWLASLSISVLHVASAASSSAVVDCNVTACQAFIGSLSRQATKIASMSFWGTCFFSPAVKVTQRRSLAAALNSA